MRFNITGTKICVAGTDVGSIKVIIFLGKNYYCLPKTGSPDEQIILVAILVQMIWLNIKTNLGCEPAIASILIFQITLERIFLEGHFLGTF